MKIAIVGSREFVKGSDVECFMEQILMLEYRNFPSNPDHPLCHKDITIISGGARGVDTYAEKFAKAHNIKIFIFKANWKDISHSDAIIKNNKFGKYDARAGMRRNQTIVNEADKIIAFWDGKSTGTKSTIDLAIKAGKPVDIHVRK
jgi:predicted Rossmann fold nucleotide-binding protein DprA/Smf involved in DNA uptake